MGDRPVRDGGDLGPARAQVARRQLAHLAGADEQHRAAREVAEHLLGERGSGSRHGGRALADRCLDASAPAGMERLAEEAIEQRAGGADLECVSHLAEDLALARHERVEAGGDAEQVERGAVVAEPVEHVARAPRRRRPRARAARRSPARPGDRRRRRSRGRAPCGCRSRAPPPRSPARARRRGQRRRLRRRRRAPGARRGPGGARRRRGRVS